MPWAAPSFTDGPSSVMFIGKRKQNVSCKVNEVHAEAVTDVMKATLRAAARSVPTASDSEANVAPLMESYSMQYGSFFVFQNFQTVENRELHHNVQ